MEMTEREKKLVDYIMLLIAELNRYAIMVAAVYKNLNIFEKNLLQIENRTQKETELVNFLRDEFGYELKVVNDVDEVSGGTK